MFYEAHELFDKERYQECLPMFKEIIEANKADVFVYWSFIFTGRCHANLGVDSLESFTKAYEIFPQRAEAMYELGNYHYNRESFREAEEFLKSAIKCSMMHQCIRYEADKYFESPHEILIDICMRQSRFNDSEELLTSLISQGNPAFYNTKKANYNHLYSRFFNNSALEFVKAKTIETNDTLVIQLPEGYDGLGDNLVFSHIPRIAKQSGKFKKVLVSNKNGYKGPGYAELVWGMNPYVDGFTDEPGTYSTIQMNRVMDKWNNLLPGLNLMDSIMLLHNLDDGSRGNRPECHYTPNTIDELRDSVVIDTGSKTIDFSLIDQEKFRRFLDENGIRPDYVVSSTRSIALPGVKEISPSSIQEWADVMYSAKNYVCINSGGYWLSASLGIRSTHIWIEGKNLPAWSYLDHKDIKVPLATISLEGI